MTLLKSWSMRLGLAASGILTFFVSNPETLVGVMAALPEGLRIPFAGFVGVSSLTLIGLSFLKDQKSNDQPPA